MAASSYAKVLHAQVQQAPRDPRHPQSLHFLSEIAAVNKGASHFSTTRWGGHASSLDPMLLIKDHLRILASLSIEGDTPRAPPEHHTPASGASSSSNSSSSSSSSGRRSEGNITLRAMCDSLDAVLSLICALMDEWCDCANESRAQGCVRALLQLFSTPEALTGLLQVTLSPAMLAAATNRRHALCIKASVCIGALQHALMTFRVATAFATEGASPAEARRWMGLLQKVELYFAMEQNLPYVEPLVLASPRVSKCARRQHPTCFLAPLCIPCGLIFYSLCGYVPSCDSLCGYVPRQHAPMTLTFTLNQYNGDVIVMWHM
jgi:hypothetical protein